MDDTADNSNFNAGGYDAKIFDAFVVIMALAFINVPACRRIKVVWETSTTIPNSVIKLRLV